MEFTVGRILKSLEPQGISSFLMRDRTPGRGYGPEIPSIEGLLRRERCRGGERERGCLVERQDPPVLIPPRIRARVELGERPGEPALVEDLVIRLPPGSDRRPHRVARAEQRRSPRRLACRGRKACK